jgi:LmbE family N-acetylglucosaminyl deacetylase
MMQTNAFLPYVQAFEDLLAQGRHLVPGPLPTPRLPAVADDAPVCLLFSPHPDDEVITGGLPWRLRRQDAWRVINVAVTLGSLQARRSARWNEASACCDHLGFGLLSASGESARGLERIAPGTARAEPAHWRAAVSRVADLLVQHQPRVVVCPHDNDGHATHIGTHLLVMDALRHVGKAVQPHLVLTEYWNTQSDPGLMVELSAADLAELVAALSLHVGEVARNPYHLTLPASCIDAVRRGAERVGAAGAAAPGFRFATLYGWRRWTGAHALPMASQWLPLGAAPGALFEA